MFSSSLPFADVLFLRSPTTPLLEKRTSPFPKLTMVRRETTHFSSRLASPSQPLHSSIPWAASLAILLWSNPVNAGMLSGFSGLESIPGPQLPDVDFLKRFNEENQKKYAENDARFKSSQVLKELLEKSKLNKERNKREIQDKYCIRGAQWGVGDCSTQGMTEQEKQHFIDMLKQKTGENNPEP